jgi:5-methylcytosine-specific restriction endonuclease McrA
MVGRCAHCGNWYTADRLAFSNHADRACSKRCTRNLGKSKRRAVERDAFVEQVSRHEIFERDEWTCMLCAEPIARDEVAPHPLSPSIDHVVPLAKGGTHEPRNVQAAHFLCNALKRDRLAA